VGGGDVVGGGLGHLAASSLITASSSRGGRGRAKRKIN
jgi:hypothetical protein